MNSLRHRTSIITGSFLILSVFITYVVVQTITNNKNITLADSTSSTCQSFPLELSLEEAESMNASSDVCWWVDSGALFSVHNGIGQTHMGPIYHGSRWRQLYALSDPIDTENGSYPQNIFRLINKVPRQDFYGEFYFNIKSYQTSKSPERNGSNGVLFLGRYVNADNLYYAGVRVDGTAVIKRKLNGLYETLGTVTLDNGTDYDRTKNPNVLPMGEWIGLSMNIKNETDARVMIQLGIYRHNTWQTVLTVIDDPSRLPNGVMLTHAGNIGIRTDFMDVEFKNYKITTL